MRIQGCVVQTTIDNKDIRFFVEHQGDEIQRHHHMGQFYEREELAIIANHFNGGLFLDIGSNVGNHVLFAAKFLNASHIHAVEPNPAAYNALRLNILLNDLSSRVTHHPVGLADAPGVATLFQPQAHNLGGARLTPVAEGTSNTFPLQTGDNLFGHLSVQFIKLDAEGLEMKVLAGLKNVIARSRPKMFIEVDHQNELDFQKWVVDNRYLIASTFRRYPVNMNYMVVPVQ